MTDNDRFWRVDMKPERWREWLNEFLDDELDVARRRLVEEGLAGDPAAARRLDELRRTKAALAGLPRHAAPAEAAPRLQRRLRALAQMLLAAYADDQLSPRWRVRVEAWLRARPEDSGEPLAGWLVALRAVKEQLGSLPREPAPPELLGRLLERLQREASAPSPTKAGTGKPSVRDIDLLLQAHADGELGPEERQRVEQMLQRSPRARRRLAEIQGIIASLRDLPRQPAPPAALAPFAARPAAAAVRSAPSRPSGRAALVAGLSLAASIALAVIGGREWVGNSREVAVVSPSQSVGPTAPRSLEEGAGTDRLWRRAAGQAAQSDGAMAKEGRLADFRNAENLADQGSVERGEREAAAAGGALDELAELPRDELEGLDQGTIRLFCRDPARAGERLWIVLADNEVAPVRDAKSARGEGADELAVSEGARPEEPSASVVEVELSPARLANVLRDLASAERGQPLFAAVEIHRPGRNAAKEVLPAPGAELAQGALPTKSPALLDANESFLRPSAPLNPPDAGLAKKADAAPRAESSVAEQENAAEQDRAAARPASKVANTALQRSALSIDKPTLPSAPPSPPPPVRLRFVLEKN